MKLKVVLLAMISTLCVVLAVNNVPAVKTDAAETFDGVVASTFAGCWDEGKSTSTYNENGVTVTVPGADTVKEEAWTYNCVAPNDVSYFGEEMSIKNGNKVSIEFSVNYYDENGNTLVQSVNEPTALWVKVLDAATEAQIVGLKIWTDAWGVKNGSHSFVINGADGDWTDYAKGGIAISGDALESSSFKVQFDTENLISSIAPNSNGKFVCFDNRNPDFLASRAAALTNVEKVKFCINGNAGWNKECRVTIKAINGVSINDRRALSEVNSYVNLGYKYTATTENEVTTYSNVDTRLQAGVDSKIAAIVTNSSSNVSWGVEVSTDVKTKQYEKPAKVDEENSISYVVIGLGDIINNIDRAKIQFTVRPYISINGQVWYSTSSKTYSVADMVKVYYEEGKPVAGLYNIFNAKGIYTV